MCHFLPIRAKVTPLSQSESQAPSRPPNSRQTVPLVEIYQKVFEGIPANTPELLREAHRLRYQVYCVENNFEDPAQNPGGLERDKYDSHSVHALLLHRASRMIVGTMRLVLHKPGVRHGCLPFHNVCGHPRLLDPDFLPFETTAELSRFAISKQFRRRINDGTYGQAYDPDELVGTGRRAIPHIALGLMTMALQFGIHRRIEHVCAVMEPALLRLLSRFGIHFELLGPQIDYHGWRQPCYAKVETLLAGVEAERIDVWEVMTDRGRLWKSSYDPQTADNYGSVRRL